MAINRKPFQGVFNIIRFNWHFYVVATIMILSSFFFKPFFPKEIQVIIFILTLFAILTLSISMIISYYVYDYSDLYELHWLPDLNNKKILSINAGFDETSEILKDKYQDIDLTIADFYNSEKHTEVSIERARKLYPPKFQTIKVETDNLPFEDAEFEYTLAILSAHEVRDEKERVFFFNELKRVTDVNGQIFITEHLRDFNNFIAYTIGFFHFHSKSTWLKTFEKANLKVKQEIKTTPFITTFILEKNGTTL